MNIACPHLKKRAKILCLLSCFMSMTCFALDKPMNREIYQSLDSQKAMAHKAAVIKRLFDVVKWQPNQLPQGAYRICLMGDFNHLQELQALNNKKAAGHLLLVKEVTLNDVKAANCQIIYMSNSLEPVMPKIIQAFDHQPVILLSDVPGFARMGGTMNFMLLNGKIALTANQVALGRNKMKLDLDAFNQITLIPDKHDIPELGEETPKD